MAMQLLLRKKAESLPDRDWESFLDLRAHTDDIRNDNSRDGQGSNRWQDLELMSQAAREYSETSESSDLVNSLIARVSGSCT